MKLEQNISLKDFNTFGVDAVAHSFVVISSVIELKQVFSELISPEMPFLVLGQGSNLLFTRDYNGVIIKNEIEGIEVVDEDDEYVYVKAGAGVNWHEFVLHCINHDWGGVENLSLIPGTVGAAPVQNIGAYGVELKDLLHSLCAWDVRQKNLVEFNNTDCAFGYRNSIFKK